MFKGSASKMSERFNRPRTPPGPPPSSTSRKSSGRGATGSSNSSKSLSTKSYGDRSFEKYDKAYNKSSSSYQSSSKDYPEDKYKSGKLSDKVSNSKYLSKEVYIDDNFKVGSVSQYLSSSQRYTDSKDSYSSKYSSDKGRYGEHSAGSSSLASTSGQYGGKKYDNYSSYPEKGASRYPKEVSSTGSYFGSSYDSYDAYDSYGSERHRGSNYGSDRVVSYGSDKYSGGGGGGGGSGGSMYGSDKVSRDGASSYGGGDKHTRGGGGGGFGGDKHGGGTVRYGDAKSSTAPRARLYGEDSRQVYRSSYSPSRSGRSDVRSYGSSYDDYNYNASSSSRSSEKQYLDRYVIGDSVVYGPPGQYPRNLRHSSSPNQHPPSPPSPAVNSSFSRYSNTSPRRYSSGRRSLTPTTSAYRSLSPTGRRPPSPPSRRPPSPDSLYPRGRDRSYDSSRSKERYNKSRASRSPIRDNNRGVSDRREEGRSSNSSSRRDPERRLDSRDKGGIQDSNKRARLDHRSSDYHSTGRDWNKDSYSSSTQGQRDSRNQHPSPNRNARRDSRTDSGSRERGRKLEGRLSLHPPSGSRRSPAGRPRVGRNTTTSPRDGGNKRPRRPDDLRLWIESRKNEGGKKGVSQGGRQVSKSGGGAGGAAARLGDRAKLKRARLRDPKKRLGNKARRAGPLFRNKKILNKYRRMAAKRGARSGAGGSASTRYSNRSNREGGGGNRRGEGGGGGGDGHHGHDGDDPKPGSTASIHRVIEKPRKVSQVNNLEIRPRVMGKHPKKLLKDPKEGRREEEHKESRSHHDRQDQSRSTQEGGSHEEDRISSKDKSLGDEPDDKSSVMKVIL